MKQWHWKAVGNTYGNPERCRHSSNTAKDANSAVEDSQFKLHCCGKAKSCKINVYPKFILLELGVGKLASSACTQTPKLSETWTSLYTRRTTAAIMKERAGYIMLWDNWYMKQSHNLYQLDFRGPRFSRCKINQVSLNEYLQASLLQTPPQSLSSDCLLVLRCDSFRGKLIYECFKWSWKHVYYIYYVILCVFRFYAARQLDWGVGVLDLCHLRSWSNTWICSPTRGAALVAEVNIDKKQVSIIPMQRKYF